MVTVAISASIRLKRTFNISKTAAAIWLMDPEGTVITKTPVISWTAAIMTPTFTQWFLKVLLMSCLLRVSDEFPCTDDCPATKNSVTPSINEAFYFIISTHPTVHVAGSGPYCNNKKLAHEWWESLRKHLHNPQHATTTLQTHILIWDHELMGKWADC